MGTDSKPELAASILRTWMSININIAQWFAQFFISFNRGTRLCFHFCFTSFWFFEFHFLDSIFRSGRTWWSTTPFRYRPTTSWNWFDSIFYIFIFDYWFAWGRLPNRTKKVIKKGIYKRNGLSGGIRWYHSMTLKSNLSVWNQELFKIYIKKWIEKIQF